MRENVADTGSQGGVQIRAIEANGIVLRVREWGLPGKPQVVLIPGTGLAAALFAGVEQLLASEWHGFSIERRGQGLSDKPESGYEFQHFANDLMAAVETLEIRNAVGIGHSAGGTDLLLAAGTNPAPWRRIAVMEPTVQDPRRPPLASSAPSRADEVVERTMRRRDGYPSFETAYERFRTAPLFSRASEAALRAYLQEALVIERDGSVTLRCPPRIEAQMLGPIVQAMDHCYRPGDGGNDPFEVIQAIRVPTTVVSTGLSDDVYREMAAIAAELIPWATKLHFDDAGHLLPLDFPNRVAALAGNPGE